MTAAVFLYLTGDGLHLVAAPVDGGASWCAVASRDGVEVLRGDRRASCGLAAEDADEVVALARELAPQQAA